MIQRTTASPHPAKIIVHRLKRRMIALAQANIATSAATPALHSRPICVPLKPMSCQ